MKQASVGGQGVIEGIMMRAPSLSAIAVRRATGEIVFSKKTLHPLSKKNKFFGLLVVRGVVSFVDTLIMGVSTISESAKMYDESLTSELEPNKLEKYVAKKTGKNSFDVMMYFAVVVALAVGIGLFFILPSVVANFLRPFISSPLLMNIIEGLIRLIIFMAYISSIALLKDIKRVYQYHGAEHKTINCYEHEEELSVENIQKYSTLHPRCGTSYLFLVMAVSILLFSLLGWSDEWWIRIGMRLLLVPVVAGVAYEILKLAAKYDNWFTRIIRAPGMALQRLTTSQPDDSMVEVAVVAFNAAMDELHDEDLQALCKNYARPVADETKETKEPTEDNSTQENLSTDDPS